MLKYRRDIIDCNMLTIGCREVFLGLLFAYVTMNIGRTGSVMSSRHRVSPLVQRSEDSVKLNRAKRTRTEVGIADGKTCAPANTR